MTGHIATYLTLALVLIVACIGGAVVITNPQTLSFHSYLDDLSRFAIGIGLLGIGRGIAARG